MLNCFGKEIRATRSLHPRVLRQESKKNWAVGRNSGTNGKTKSGGISEDIERDARDQIVQE